MIAENALKTPRTSDDLLRYPYSNGLFDALPLGIVFQNPQGEITAANPAAETMLGLTLDQMRGVASTDPRWRAIHEDGSPFPGAEHPAMVALRTGQPVDEVVMGVFNPRIDGPSWIKIKAIPLRDGDHPEIRGVYTVFEDITDRRLMERAADNERAVIESQRWIRAMLDHLFAYVALLDTQGVVQDVNRAPLERSGYRRDEVIGRYFPDTPWWSYDEQVQARLIAAIDQARHGETTRYDAAVPMGGDIVTIDFQLSPVVAANGEIERLLATGVDISERMTAKERLRLSEDKYRSLVENTKDCIWETDEQGRFTYLSPGFQEITGYSPADFLGKVAYDIPHGDVRAKQVREEMMALAANRQRLPAIERQIQHRDGRLVSVEVRATPMFGPDGDFRGMQGTTQDITVRKQAEQALERSHAALEQAQALTHLGSWQLDFASQRMEWSKETYHIHGMEPGTPVDPQTHFPFIHPDDFAAFESAWQATLNGAPYDLTHRIIVKGEVKWVHARAEIQCDEDGRPQSAIGTVQDVTARKQAELALTEKTGALLRAEQQLREILDTLPVGVVAVDLETKRITYANDCLCQMLGREREGVVAMNPLDFFPAEHRAMNITRFEKALRGEVAWEPELPVERGDGTVFLAEVRNILAVLDGRRCLLGVFTDISERQRQEAAQRAAEATAARLQGEMRWKEALEAGGHGVWDWHVDSGFVDFSLALKQMLGYDEADISNDVSEWSSRVHPDDLAATEAALEAHFAGETPGYTSVHRLRCKDGGWKWTLDCGAVYERDAAGKPLRMLGTHTDITAQKEAEERLRASEAEIRVLNADLEAKVAARTAEARAASAAKSEFLAHMSHEIRTPLNGVLGLAQLLSREPLSANQQDMVGRIQEAGQSLLGIINDVLDFSKIEAGQLQLAPRPFHLDSLTARLESLFGASAAAKGLALRIEPSPASLGPLLGDALRLEQILTNLTGNAIKFTEQGQVALRIHTLTSHDHQVRLRFEVQDTGIGISPEVQATLFTPFTQGDAGITRRFGGTGLGLSISKRLVAMMGGEIGVASQPGQGSTFWFEVSLPRAIEAEEVSAAPPPMPSGPRLRGLRLLAVDDSAMNRDLVERALTLEGAALTLAADGQQAVHYLQSAASGFDAVLMDVQMPVMDGLTATRLIRQELGLTDLPILALTAGVLPEEQQAARDAGANEVLAKPLDLDLLVTRLVHHLGAERLTAASAEAGLAASVATPVQTGSAEVPDIPGIDREWVKLVFQDDVDFFLALLQRMTQEAAASLFQARQALASGDRETAMRCLHSLKGSAGNLGALTLMAAAGELEAALKAGTTDVETGLADLERQVADLSAASAQWLPA